MKVQQRSTGLMSDIVINKTDGLDTAAFIRTLACQCLSELIWLENLEKSPFEALFRPLFGWNSKRSLKKTELFGRRRADGALPVPASLSTLPEALPGAEEPARDLPWGSRLLLIGLCGAILPTTPPLRTGAAFTLRLDAGQAASRLLPLLRSGSNLAEDLRFAGILWYLHRCSSTFNVFSMFSMDFHGFPPGVPLCHDGHFGAAGRRALRSTGTRIHYSDKVRSGYTMPRVAGGSKWLALQYRFNLRLYQ